MTQGAGSARPKGRFPMKTPAAQRRARSPRAGPAGRARAGGIEQFRAPEIHRPAMPAIDFQEQPSLGLEVIGDAARIGTRGLRNVADRDGAETVGGEQLFRRAQDRFAQIRFARRDLLRAGAVGAGEHVICTNVQKIRSGQQKPLRQRSAGDVAECQRRTQRNSRARLIPVHDRGHIVAAGPEAGNDRAVGS